MKVYQFYVYQQNLHQTLHNTVICHTTWIYDTSKSVFWTQYMRTSFNRRKLCIIFQKYFNEYKFYFQSKFPPKNLFQIFSIFCVIMKKISQYIEVFSLYYFKKCYVITVMVLDFLLKNINIPVGIYWVFFVVKYFFGGKPPQKDQQHFIT